MREIILGHGMVEVSCIEISSSRQGILLRPAKEAHPINSRIPDTSGPYVAQEGDVVIWCDNIEGFRVLQDAVSMIGLELDGYSVTDKIDA